MQRDTLADELRAAQTRLTLITRMLNEGETTMSITVERTTVPAMRVIALRGVVPTYRDEGMLWQRMMPLVQAQGVRPIGPCGVIEHDDEYVEHDVDLSIYLPVAADARVEEPLEFLELPERDCLVARVVGPYDQISAAHDLINERALTDGLKLRERAGLAGRTFNRYLTTPDEVSPRNSSPKCACRSAEAGEERHVSQPGRSRFVRSGSSWRSRTNRRRPECAGDDETAHTAGQARPSAVGRMGR